MKNTAASVRARLANLSRAEGVTLDFMIERFAIGRLLWRLSQSPDAHRFILKGAQLFSIWLDNPHRPTRDIDFLGIGDPSEEAMREFFTALCSMPADSEDGLIWGKPKAGPIREDQRYGGIRLLIPVSLAGAQVRLQVDIGFGDVITPAAEEHTWKELLGYPEARLLTYPPETVIAEKLEAAVQLDIDNSRMKDFYDIDWLAGHKSFDHATLRQAIERTFERRQSDHPTELPFALTQAFANDPVKQTQWNAFLRKGKLEAPPFSKVIERIGNFLAPVILDRHTSNSKTWHPASGWTEFSS
ncbi:MAG: nucleotidyl transferase AbiEii/AbiGii toxin family protein [Verrucomicrobia bacterium]|nr:nucleotidyl transferase AbiEii/AbiGii toxin family protein [Verrucomicrobiota bacterium]MDA1005120.1 nucleotidyl transferase AbiEii/AbiGii toxin family protein [Verrucomicrobiota bacterium]